MKTNSLNKETEAYYAKIDSAVDLLGELINRFILFNPHDIGLFYLRITEMFPELSEDKHKKLCEHGLQLADYLEKNPLQLIESFKLLRK